MSEPVNATDPSELLSRQERRANKAQFTRYSVVKGAVYHASENSFDSFDTTRSDLGVHLGTVQQANRVAEVRLGRIPGIGAPNIIPVYIDLRRPLRLKDVGTFHADGIADQLEKKGILAKGEGKRIIKEIDADWTKRKIYDPLVRDAIIKAGHDGIVYENTTEGPGKSYIVFEPTQIKSAIGAQRFDRTNPHLTDQRIASAEKAFQMLAELDPTPLKTSKKLAW